MGDLDGIDAGGVQRGHDPPDVLGRDPVPDRVHAVTQRDVLNEQCGHRAFSCFWAFWAIRSPTCSAAEVMMSRFPA